MERTTFNISNPATVPLSGTVEEFLVSARPSALTTVVTLLVNGVATVASVEVAANPVYPRVKRCRATQPVEVTDGDVLSYSALATPKEYDVVSVTKFPVAGFSNWETWQFGGEVPPWFSENLKRKCSDVIMYARANQAVFVRGTVSGWDDTTKKFRISLTEKVGDVTPYNSWGMTLDPARLGAATIENVTATYCYEVPVPEPEPQPPPVDEVPQSPKKKRRIMM